MEDKGVENKCNYVPGSKDATCMYTQNSISEGKRQLNSA